MAIFSCLSAKSDSAGEAGGQACFFYFGFNVVSGDTELDPEGNGLALRIFMKIVIKTHASLCLLVGPFVEEK